MEILFRGKRINNGEWIEGYFTTDTQITGGKEKTRFLIGNDWDYYEIIPKSLGMFTGMTDKNRVKIFGKVSNGGCGDIIRSGIFTGIVFYSDDGFLVRLHGSAVGRLCELLNMERQVGGQEYEVIGNSLDNPELMEQ